jgi:hypothetical protein
MESAHGSSTCCLSAIVDKGAVALGDEEQTLDVIGCFA